MKIGLINFNSRGVSEISVPPVPPIGLEYLVDDLLDASHNVDFLDLCFVSVDNRADAIKKFLQEQDVIGITLRNIGIDDFWVKENQFFVDDLKNLVTTIRQHSKSPIVLGGQGFSIYPKQILDYVDANFGIVGPGETALVTLLSNIESLPQKTIIYGTPNNNQLHKRNLIDYDKYIQAGGAPAIQTKFGCPMQCAFCVEATKKASCRQIDTVFDELNILLNRGYKFIYIADAEFNSNFKQAHMICDRILEESLMFKWSTYLNPIPLSEELVRKMKAAGCVAPCISVVSGDDSILQTLRTGFSTRDVMKMAEWFHKYDFPFTVDLLFGSPGETIESARKTVDLMRKIQPEIVGMNLGIRIYGNTGFGKRFLAREFQVEGKVFGNTENNDDLFLPIFYISDRQIGEYLKEVCDADNSFRLLGYSGFQGVNYKIVKEMQR